MQALFSRFALEAAVFACGAIVMIYEITGSRIVAPYIGTSTYVWTSLIGVVLAALSLGYWIGGKTADRRPDAKVLAAAVFLAGGAVSLTVLIKDLVLAALAAAGGALEIKAVVAALILFAPASIMLGFVAPYAIKLRMRTLDDSGKTAGRLFALSTVGSIAGTFLAGFVLIPFVGSTRTLYLIASLLFLVSLLIAPLALARRNVTVLLLFGISVASSEASSYYLFRKHGLVDLDTSYSRVRIYETENERTGRPFRALATDPYFAQSAMYLDDGTPVFEYIPFYHLVRHFKPDHEHSLMIGGAGFTFPQEYLRTYSSARMDVVEIDPRMTELARQYFGLRDDPRLAVFHEDGRTFLNRAPSNTYDAVMVDAFGSLFSIPHQLTTVEAVREMHRVLRDNGIVIINIGSAISGRGSLFLQAEIATYKQVFDDVLLFKVRPERRDAELQNVILVARRSAAALPCPNCPDLESSTDAEITRMLLTRFTSDLPHSQPVLTDDLAPVERYNSLALSEMQSR
ncbi:MAG TPA: fused MFS/spermidine synthase [Pyrinomonadaceae bacterium]|nr:fused MFS/spermidine synthase [Pyrinomonadaceae bacterium]